MYPIKMVFGTVVRSNLLREELVGPDWLRSISRCHRTRLKSAINPNVGVAVTFILHARILENRIRVMFGIIQLQAAPILLGKKIIN